jgi:hypothetical protein
LLFWPREDTLSVKQEIPDVKTMALSGWMLLLLAVAAVSGCATHALWADANLGSWHQPAHDPTLRLFRGAQPGELLVLYQESSEPHDARRTRAYLLYRNASRIERQKHPKFVKIDSIRGLEPVPVFVGTNGAGAVPPPLYAVLSTNNLWFTLYSSGTIVGSYSLPEYRDGMGRMERIALTPLAVTADVTMVGGAAAAVAGYIYVSGRAGPSADAAPSGDSSSEGSFFQSNQQ